MALEHPDKTEQIVLIDSAGYPIKKPFVIRMAKIPFAGEITRLFFGRYVVESTLKEVLFNDDMVTEEKIDAYFHRMSTENAVYAQVGSCKII